MRGYKLLRVTNSLTPTLSQPKSDVSDFSHVIKWPNSGKPEFGWGEGARRAVPRISVYEPGHPDGLSSAAAIRDADGESTSCQPGRVVCSSNSTVIAAASR